MMVPACSFTNVKMVVLNGFTVISFTGGGRRREMGLGALRDVPLKQARELATGWRAVLREGCAPIKEREKRKREAMRNLHYLKDIALDAFESCKAELKMMVKMETGFHL